MQGTNYVFRSERIASALDLTTKHYALDPGNHDGAVLILIHGAGFNKEIWQPLLQDLAANQQNLDNRNYISEAWTFDCPNHGEAAALNDESLWRDQRDITLEDFARVGLALLLSNRILNLDHRPIVLAGHSAGAASTVILTALYHQYTSRLPDRVILLEPPAELFLPFPSAKQMAESWLDGTRKRRDIWPSREAARDWFSKRKPWSAWDPRALDAYVQGGLRSLPSMAYPDKQGVTLACYKFHEAFAYTNLGEMNSASRLLRYLRHVRDVNMIFGGDSFLRPSEAAAKDITERLGFYVATVPGTGHLIVQEKPKELAALFHVYCSGRKVQEQEKSKL